MWHRPVASQSGNDVVFAGNTYDYRHFLIRKLIDHGEESIRLYGNPPPRWADPRIRSYYQGKFIVREEKSAIFGKALACINSTAMSEGNSINCRTFEIAGAGALQIMEYRQAIEDCFEPGKEILTYSTFDELVDTLAYYRSHPDKSIPIREAANRRVIMEHTYEHRLATILKTVFS
jgi:spore maturation protein CgeB